VHVRVALSLGTGRAALYAAPGLAAADALTGRPDRAAVAIGQLVASYERDGRSADAER
jgi:hypothetical protein